MKDILHNNLNKQPKASVYYKETSKWLKDTGKETFNIHDELTLYSA